MSSIEAPLEKKGKIKQATVIYTNLICFQRARLFSLANDSMQMGILHTSAYADINIRATIKAQYAFLALVEILGDTAAVAAFLAIMSLCSNLVRGSHAGAMRVAAFVLAGLLEVLGVLDWAFNVAYYAYSVQSFDIGGLSGPSYEQMQSKIEDTFVMQVKVQWALAIFELVVVLVAVARAVFVLVRGGGGGKSASGSKAVSQFFQLCVSCANYLRPARLVGRWCLHHASRSRCLAPRRHCPVVRSHHGPL